ncbi:MAG TPA: rhodanese-like domain-containing protein [Steroidobacteraceae bacterium]|nr:rhodanese-like domain-containing protein [Steroidobacteraceae bacterium]
MKTFTALRSMALLALLAGSQALQVHAAEQAADKPAQKPVVPKLERAQLDEWLAKPDKIVVIDLRRPDEHQSIGALPVFLSIQNADLEKYLEYIPRDRAVITVSNHASRANKAAAVLLKHGFKVVGEVGVEDYEQQGGHLARIQPPPPKTAAAAAPAAAH